MSAASNLIRDSIAALPVPLQDRWWATIPPRKVCIGVPIHDGGSSFFAAAVANYDASGSPEDQAVAAHIALLASPEVAAAVADLLDAIPNPLNHGLSNQQHQRIVAARAAVEAALTRTGADS